MKTNKIEIRIEPEHAETFRAAATRAGLSLAAWMRERLLRIARRELAETKESKR